MLKNKWIVGIVLLALASGGMMMSYGKSIDVETLLVEVTDFEDTMIEDGQVMAAEDWKLHSEVTGIVVAVYKDEGDLVGKGEAIAQIDTTALVLSRKGLQGQLIRLQGEDSNASKLGSDVLAQQKVVRSAQATYDQLLIDYSRSEALYQSGGLSKQSFENIELQMKEAGDQLAMQEDLLASAESNYSGQLLQVLSQIEQVERDIAKCTLRSGIEGRLAEFDLSVGDAVYGMDQLASVLSEDGLEIEVMVLADKVYGLSEGQSVKVIRTLNGGDESVEGTIVSIAPSAVEQVSALGLEEKRVKVTIACDEVMIPALIKGADVEVEFVVHKAVDAIVVPLTAVFYTASGDAVWVVRDGKVSMEVIETGYKTSRFVEVVTGLNEGDEIVKYYDSDDVEEGADLK